MHARFLVAALAALALAPIANALVEAPRLAEVYRNGVHVERFDDGEITCANGGFATLTIDSTGAAFITLESLTCVNFAGPFQGVGSFEGGWVLDYALATDSTTYRATLSADAELPEFTFDAFVFDDATGADMVVHATGLLRAVVAGTL